jgi:hypothetical protein
MDERVSPGLGEPAEGVEVPADGTEHELVGDGTGAALPAVDDGPVDQLAATEAANYAEALRGYRPPDAPPEEPEDQAEPQPEPAPAKRTRRAAAQRDGEGA